MKKLALFFFAIFSFLINVNAQDRTEIAKDVYLVSYGNKLIIEDDVNQRSISLEVYQEQVDRQNAEMMYKVVCGKYQKIVVKWALRTAIAEGIKLAAPSGGLSLTASAIALAADLGYEAFCDYLDSKR